MQLTQTYLIEKKIKPSTQRIAVMKYLLEHRTHPTVDEIFGALSKFYPTLSKTTIYNTLNLFAEKGAISLITIDPKNVRFDADLTPHAHFQCSQCGRVFDIPIPDATCTEFERLHEGFQVSDTQIYYKGICPSCSKRKKETEK